MPAFMTNDGAVTEICPPCTGSQIGDRCDGKGRLIQGTEYIDHIRRCREIDAAVPRLR